MEAAPATLRALIPTGGAWPGLLGAALGGGGGSFPPSCPALRDITSEAVVQRAGRCAYRCAALLTARHCTASLRRRSAFTACPRGAGAGREAPCGAPGLSGSQKLFFYQKSCQTAEVATAEAAVQSRSSRDAAVQTDRSAARDVHHGARVDDSGVLAFLRRVEEVVTKELNKNVTSRAFDGFDVNWTDQNRTVSWQRSDPSCYLGQLLTEAVTPQFCALLP